MGNLKKKHVSPICMFDPHLAKLQWAVDACTKIMLGG